MKSFKNKLWGSPVPKSVTDLIDIVIYKDVKSDFNLKGGGDKV